MSPAEIYPKHPTADAYKVGGAYQPYAIVGADKRFTEAELAAEYHAADSLCRREQWIETVRGDDDYTDTERQGQAQMYGRLNTLHRFAVAPHCDEADA